MQKLFLHSLPDTKWNMERRAQTRGSSRLVAELTSCSSIPTVSRPARRRTLRDDARRITDANNDRFDRLTVRRCPTPWGPLKARRQRGGVAVSVAVPPSAWWCRRQRGGDVVSMAVSLSVRRCRRQCVTVSHRATGRSWPSGRRGRHRSGCWWGSWVRRTCTGSRTRPTAGRSCWASAPTRSGAASGRSAAGSPGWRGSGATDGDDIRGEGEGDVTRELAQVLRYD